MCNYSCSYCVSTGDYAKSESQKWFGKEFEVFDGIVDWLITLDRSLNLRMGTIGEPFTTPDFVRRVGDLLRSPNINFVELTSNASLLDARLPALAQHAPLERLSLWLTYHPTETDLRSFMERAQRAVDSFGCCVVVNYLVFDGERKEAARFVEVARSFGMQFNLDLGYAPDALYVRTGATSSVSRQSSAPAIISELGGNAHLTSVALNSLNGPITADCRAGHQYMFIDKDGFAFRCSRYCDLAREPMGNVLDHTFGLSLYSGHSSPCGACAGCAAKEDFLNRVDAPQRGPSTLGVST
jgi:hypothetical protein